MSPNPIRPESLPNDAAGLAEAAARLKAGRLVAFPTETVYGLGADATDGAAVARIYAAKGRPTFNPLIAHVADTAAAERLVRMDPVSRHLAAAFWPGPLTLVLPRRPDCPVSDLVTAGLDTLAVRVPDHPVAQALLAAAGLPVAAPSANRSGRISPTDAAHVLAEFAGQDVTVVDGGPTRVGLESTIVHVTNGVLHILRPGGVTREALVAALARAGLSAVPIAASQEPSGDPDRPLAPGMLLSHYAPAARVLLDQTVPPAGAAFLAFGPVDPGAAHARPMLNLSPAGDLAEAAANLFRHLRALDATGAAVIAVAPIPDQGLGAAIRDRLGRAAAAR
ncbi:L-threonylcarbamoyladenylate synthase [Mongoliimonas terrestris]|uniref:L-threonylcarbamoyladenylate synthase n=1 Tax=Mongoliimonas terrestris TaxID=1709001 RepID=UPI0009F86628|nr:L-threonylcarbamoyladenylate synthase [Mongoliimonas terrestris]